MQHATEHTWKKTPSCRWRVNCFQSRVGALFSTALEFSLKNEGTWTFCQLLKWKGTKVFKPDSLHPQRGSPSKDHFWKVWTHWTHRVSTKESIRLVSRSLFQVSHMFSLIMHKLVAHPSLLSSTPASKPLTELKGTWTLFSASETM